jgi:hypothetical protein
MFNLIPGHIVCFIGVAGMGTLPYGVRWLVDEVRVVRRRGAAASTRRVCLAPRHIHCNVVRAWEWPCMLGVWRNARVRGRPRR